MTRLWYFTKTALRGMRRTPLRSALCAATTGVALAVLGAYLLLYANVDGLLSNWGSDLDLSVYLRDDISVQAREDLRASLTARPVVAEVRFVDRAAAGDKLAREWPREGPEETNWPAHAALLRDVDDLPVEASFEVRLQPTADLRGALAKLAAEVNALPGVAATDFGERELGRVEMALELLRNAGAALAVILALAAMFMIGATVRLAIRERRDELEIMRLCGATNAFIRAPLYLEGALQGVLGGGVAVGLVALLHGFLESAVGEVFSNNVQLTFLSTELAFIVVVGAMLLGALGSAMAASRYLRA